MRRRPTQNSSNEFPIEDLFLTRDWIKLRTLVVLAEPLPPIPVGAIGQVVHVGPDAALVRFRKHHAASVKFSDLERASFIDLLLLAAQPIARRFGGWTVAGIGAAGIAAIGLAVDRLFIHLFGR